MDQKPGRYHAFIHRLGCESSVCLIRNQGAQRRILRKGRTSDDTLFDPSLPVAALRKTICRAVSGYSFSVKNTKCKFHYLLLNPQCPRGLRERHTTTLERSGFSSTPPRDSSVPSLECMHFNAAVVWWLGTTYSSAIFQQKNSQRQAPTFASNSLNSSVTFPGSPQTIRHPRPMCLNSTCTLTFGPCEQKKSFSFTTPKAKLRFKSEGCVLWGACLAQKVLQPTDTAYITAIVFKQHANAH